MKNSTSTPKIDISDTGLAKICKSVFFVVALIFCIWLAWNTWYSIPSADDFCYGFGMLQRGVVQNVVHEYLTWGGRFSAATLISLFAGSNTLLLQHYYLVPAGILLLNILSVRHFLMALNLKSYALVLFFVVMLIVKFQMRESLFWLSGGATYGVACALFLGLIAEEWRIFSGELIPSKRRIVLLCVGGILLAGLNEVVALAHVVLVCLVSITILVQKKNSRLILWIAAAAIAGAVITLAAPGNYIRADITAPHRSILLAVGSSLLILVTKYTATALIHTLSFSILIWSCRLQRRISIRRDHVWFFIIFLILTLWAAIFPRAYALGELGPDRARTIDFLLVNLISFFSAVLFTQRWQADTGKPRPVLAVSIAAIFLFCIGIAIFIPKVSVGSVLDGMRESQNLHTLMGNRFAIVQNADGQSLTVDAYSQQEKPVTFFNDIKSDAKAWENACFSAYFKLKAVKTH